MSRRNLRSRPKHLRRIGLGLLAAIALWAAIVGTRLYQAAQQPPDAVLVLGGSIRREMVLADEVAGGLDLPILISQGSAPPCIRILFERVQARLDTVWLEECADSTFDNFRYSLPTLKQWGARHVRVVTSPSHGPRAHRLAQVMLGSHGIWVEMELVDEQGVPGNTESALKTTLDVMRGTLWAIASQVYRPGCDAVLALNTVDLAEWEERGYRCEHQAGIDTP